MVVLLVAACESSRPDYLIDDDDMEELLYDIHRAHFTYKDGQDIRYDGPKQYAMFLKVLQKHKVSQADWDSSMVYYCSHADELQKIYDNLSNRLEREAEMIGASLTDSGDSTNIWREDDSMILTTYQPYTTHQWSIPADTLLKAGEKLTLSFTALFLQEAGIKHGQVVLAVKLKNDSVLVSSQGISRTGIYNLQLVDRDATGIKEVKGLFMMHKSINYDGMASPSSSASQILCIKDIRLKHEVQQDQLMQGSNMPTSTSTPDTAQTQHPALPNRPDRMKLEPLREP